MNAPDENAALLIFTKVPFHAPVKTRLITGSLDKAHADLLASAFLADVISTAASLTDQLVLSLDPLLKKEALVELLSKYPAFTAASVIENSRLIAQEGEHFGARLEAAVQSANSGNGVVVLGADSPMIPKASIAKALHLTAAGRYVVGPATGGGMYLIGIPNDAITNAFPLREVFGGSRTELELFSRKVQQHGGVLDALDLHFDVDIPADLATLGSLLELQHLCQADRPLGTAPCTRQALEQLQISIEQDSQNNREIRITENSRPQERI